MASKGILKAALNAVRRGAGEERGVTYEQLDKAWLFEIGRRVNGRIRGV